jgi:preprotein translocase subunit SecD
MKRNLLWRGLIILASILLAVVFAYPPQRKINLGLDLRGGMYLKLQVHTEDALRAETDGDMARLAQQVKEDAKLDIKPQRTGDMRFVVPALSADGKSAVLKAADRVLSRFGHSEQSDSVTFQMVTGEASKLRDQSVNQAVTTIRNRIDTYGVTEPVIQSADQQRIVVQLPGVDDPERVRQLIKNTAFLEFRMAATACRPRTRSRRISAAICRTTSRSWRATPASTATPAPRPRCATGRSTSGAPSPAATCAMRGRRWAR